MILFLASPILLGPLLPAVGPAALTPGVLLTTPLLSGWAFMLAALFGLA